MVENNYMYVFGGRSDDAAFVDSIERHSMQTSSLGEDFKEIKLIN